MFTEPTAAAGRGFPVAAVAIAAVAVVIVVAVLLAVGRRHGAPAAAANTVQSAAAYAANLKLSDVQMSESTSFSGGKETYVDGRMMNAGPSTVTGVTMQVLFAPDGGGAAQLETVPLNLIRMRQPYVDTEPVSAAPIAPGATAEFRLIFDDVKPEWNQQTPEMHVITVTTR